MTQIEIDKEEILKTSKWIRFLFMLLYGFVINFALTLCIGLAIIQFLFYLFTSKPNASIANFNSHLLEFFHDSLAFLLFQTEEKPFPFKENQNDDDIINDVEGEVIEAELDTDNSSETEVAEKAKE
jgi:hypothetical protein